jgi:hypothetical protein
MFLASVVALIVALAAPIRAVSLAVHDVDQNQALAAVGSLRMSYHLSTGHHAGDAGISISSDSDHRRDVRESMGHEVDFGKSFVLVPSYPIPVYPEGPQL